MQAQEQLLILIGQKTPLLCIRMIFHTNYSTIMLRLVRLTKRELLLSEMSNGRLGLFHWDGLAKASGLTVQTVKILIQLIVQMFHTMMATFYLRQEMIKARLRYSVTLVPKITVNLSLVKGTVLMSLKSAFQKMISTSSQLEVTMVAYSSGKSTTVLSESLIFQKNLLIIILK